MVERFIYFLYNLYKLGDKMSMTICESMDKCLGQDSCNECPRYLDDCDGKEW